MKRNRLLCGVLGLVGAVLVALPVEAARLESWRFDARQNRLEFVTDTPVQPRAQLIFNPTRLVIDLPGTSLGGASVPQRVRQEGIREVRVGQFDTNTARIVIEFEPGYTVDPQRVQVRGETDRRWSVQLPPVEAVSAAAGLTSEPALENRVSGEPVQAASTVQGIVATADGFFVRTRGEVPQVSAEQVRGGPMGRQLVVSFVDSAIAPTLRAEALPVNRYSVSSWEVNQLNSQPPVVRVVMNLAASSPDWTVAASDIGGAVILPAETAIGSVPDGGPAAGGAVVRPVPAAEPPAVELPPAAPPPAEPPPLPATEPPAIAQSDLPRLPQSRFLVVIDPGHGGRDPGAVGIGGLQEKEVIFPIAQRVAALLQQQGVDVVLTRSSDVYLDLDTRVQVAERAGADFFVSIHANAINLSRPDVNGLETYYYSSGGQAFARDVHEIVLREMQMNDRQVRQARFYVIRRTSMPAILIETGFVTGAADAPNLRDPQWRDRMAEAIARGILAHLQRHL